MISNKAIPPRFPPSYVQAIASELYGIDVASVKDLGSYVDQNFLLTDASNQHFTFKIHDGTEKEAVLDLQNEAMHHLSGKVAGVQFPRVIKTVLGEDITDVQGKDGLAHQARLLSYLPGTLLKDADPQAQGLLGDVGRVLGEMDTALADFYHPAENRPDIPWDLKNAANLKRLLVYIENPQERRLADYFLLLFETEVAPDLPDLRKTVVHNDAHRYSMLVGENSQGQQRVSGIIDFGDTVYTYSVSNIAICVSDVMVQSEDPIATAAQVIAGYHRVNPLTEQEVTLLYRLIGARLAIYGCMSAYSRAKDPHNSHARLKEVEVWQLMEKLISINPLYAQEAFRAACGMDSLTPQIIRRREIKLKKRQAHFARSLYTHYAEPLHLSGGAFQYLYDDTGRAYFDCVNNVCQWGHCHPRIVRAAQRQMARLNTNSRYVYDVMTEYAERLLATFPDPLNVCFFVNSGSEANDLALRLARTYTGENDIIVIDKAYHGNSTVCTEISPHRIDRPGKPGLPGHVHKTVTPDTLRGLYKGDDVHAGVRYAADVQNQIEALAQQGKGVAAFIAESMIGTGGQIVLPDGYLEAVYNHVRTAGGITIADEVQMGFARVGSHTWCFETQRVVPDIVTLGKPIGNGHPMAALITTREIADAYDRGGVTYFNTFGGNPVSCATGLAVLDVLQDERLQENALQMGIYLMAGLKQLQGRYPVIADVRGLGLYVGVDLVEDLVTLAPATALAGEVVERMKQRGILLNTNGYDNNIIKIKPPLIITEQDVKRLLNALDQVFTELVTGN